MATLKVIKNRIKAVTNIRKITRTMRLVSAAKFSRAERDLDIARPLGQGSKSFYDQAEVSPPIEIESQLLVVISSDRGLCGAIHSGLAKSIRLSLERGDQTLRKKTKIISIGAKNQVILSKFFPRNMLWSASEVGKKPITFVDAARLAEAIRSSIIEHNLTKTKVYYNRFVNAVSYKIDSIEVHDKNAIYAGKKFHAYDEIDEDIVDSFIEFSLASMLFWMMKEGAACEHSARMTAMESATRNAGDMINRLTLKFNRTRQAVITKELIEIISGANSLQKS